MEPIDIPETGPVTLIWHTTQISAKAARAIATLDGITITTLGDQVALCPTPDADPKALAHAIRWALAPHPESSGD